MIKSIVISVAVLLCVACNNDPILNSNEEENNEQQQTNEELAMPTGWGIEPNLNALTRNAVVDYGVVSGSGEDQTSKLQSALNDIESWGGGNLIIPEGEYHIARLYMRSNVHILVSCKATLKPYYPGYQGYTQIINMIEFSPSYTESEDGEFVENCSISCLEGVGFKYTVDNSDFYSDIEANANLYSAMYHEDDELTTLESELFSLGGMNKVRFARGKLVRNFLIADVQIINNYSTCCGMVFVGADTDESITQNWEITRPTNGVIRDCKISNASHGYGLCQTHSGQHLLFENLWANGGVTLRLEAHVGNNVGLFDIYGHNIYNEYGKAAVLFQPHSTHHGTMTIEGVTAISAAHGVLIREGFTGETSSGFEAGTFSNDCRVNNINVTYGEDAQIEEKDYWIYEPELWLKIQNVYKRTTTTISSVGAGKFAEFNQFEGPSYAPIFDDTKGTYKVTCTNVTYSGFDTELYGTLESDDGILYSENLDRVQGYIWSNDRLDVYKYAIKNY